ncbi:MAG: hypothetical protein KBA31_09230 [Alphaproteobacteria bacterium]|nr:hypothetical protein [Alphaproteobacteria bacterium]
MQLPTKEHELKKFLATLPADKAAKLAAAVETGRVAGERAMPIDLILDGLRPTLRRINARRVPTTLRLLCEPFADFLVDDPREFKQPGRIARSSVKSLWRWLKDTLRVALADMETQVSRAVLSRDVRLQSEIVPRLQAEVLNFVRAALDRATPGSADRRVLANRLGGEDALHDVEEAMQLLAGAGELSPLRGLLPRRIDTLTEQHGAFVRDIYDQMASRQSELCPYVGLLVLARLKRPWEALRLGGIISRRTNQALFSQSDMGIVGDVLLADMENLALDIASVRPDTLDTDTLLTKLDRFVQMSGGLVREIGGRRDGKWGQRLIKIRQLASDAMDALIVRAPREIMAALPVQKLGAFGGRGPRRPDLARDPDPAKIDRAMVWGRLLAGSMPYAGGGSFYSAHKDAFEEVSQYLRGYAESMMAELRTLEFDRRPRAQAFQVHAEALSDLVLGIEETDQIRRKAASMTPR